MNVLFALGLPFFLLGLTAAVIYLLRSNAMLRARVEDLQHRVSRIEFGPMPAGASESDTGPAPSSRDAATAVRDDDPATRDAAARMSQEPSGPDRSDISPSDPAGPPRAFVFTRDRLVQLSAWLREYWVFGVAALSLALSGVFFVQYGIETGLLSPPLRVLAAIALGLGLVGAGEWVRRKARAAERAPAGYLSATLAGAGLVSVFAGVIAARQLYGLVGPEITFAGLVLTGAGAVLLGWYHGPFLAAIGLIGASAAPFLVGGDSASVSWLFGYFGLVVIVGLMVDAARRWAWISTLVLGLGYGAAGLVYLGAGGGVWYLAFALGVVLATAIIPVWSLRPAHQGTSLGDSVTCLILRRPPVWPDFPVRLVATSIAACVAIALVTASDAVIGFWASYGALVLLVGLVAIWLRDAPALSDLAVLPALGLPLLLVVEALKGGGVYASFVGWVAPNPEAAPPGDMLWIAVGAGLAAILAGLQSLAAQKRAILWSAVGASILPAVLVALELTWSPGRIIGAAPWAFHALAAAAVMTFLSERHARVSIARPLRVSLFVISSLTLIALALFLVLTKGALSVALALMVLIAVALDRRFDLPPLGVFSLIGVAVIGWRSVVDPGIFWAIDEQTGWIQVLLAYLVPGLILAAAWALAAARPRIRVVLESAVWVIGVILVSILLFRWLNAVGQGFGAHWKLGLLGAVWLAVALGQVYRARLGGVLVWLRILLGAFSALVAMLALGLAVFVLSPLSRFGGDVLGLWMINSILVAYGLPAVLLLGAAKVMDHLPRRLRLGLLGTGCAFAGFAIALCIRHVWRGPDLSVPGVSNPELYSYTLALMLLAAGLMIRAWSRKSQILRKLGVAVVGVTILKVFVIDMGELTGLLRVMSFLGLGLALAGLAMVNQWISAALGDGQEAAPPES